MMFYKYSCLGNDFLLVFNKSINQKDISKILDRHDGVGGDGIIILKSDSKEFNQIEVFNSDGSKAKMCGNALKIVASFLYFLYKDKKFIVSLNGNNYEVGGDGTNFFANVPKARFKRKDGEYYLLNVSNYHAIKIVDNFNESVFFNDKARFSGYNITHIKLLSHNEVDTLTYENGVGFTRSCGSAAIAIFTLLNELNIISNDLILHSKGGTCYLKGTGEIVSNTSEVKLIYKGEIRC